MGNLAAGRARPKETIHDDEDKLRHIRFDCDGFVTFDASYRNYSINDLFSLCNISRHKYQAIVTLQKVLKCSKNLNHPNHLYSTRITQHLVDRGILSQAMWLIENAGLEKYYLADGLSLIHTIIVEDNNDRCLMNWPDLRMTSCQPRLMSHESTKAERDRQLISLLQPMEIHDDLLLNEDIITYLVMNKHLVTLISTCMVASNFLMPQVDVMILQILQRIAAHSPEMANHLVNEHENLIAGLMQTHLNTESSSCVHLLRLLRLIVGTSQLLANKINDDMEGITEGNEISVLYTIIEEVSVDVDAKIEALRLLTVLVLQGVHLHYIAERTKTIIDTFVESLGAQKVTPYSQSVAMFLVAVINSNVEIQTETYIALTYAVGRCKAKIKDTIHLRNSFPAMSTLVHLCNIFFRHQYSSRNEFSTQVAISYWNDLVCPLLQSNIFPVVYEHASLNTILGYEHWHPSITLVKLDLTNLLQYSTTLAGQTANPANFVDSKPFLINLHPSFSMLSALSQMLLSMTDSEMETSLLPNFAESFSNLVNNEFLTEYLTKISETPMDKIVPSTAPYSAIVQLELETLSHVLLTIVGVSQWTKAPLSHHFATILYKVAVRILPFLGPDLQYLAQKLSEAILFSPTIIGIMESGLPQEVKSLLLHQLPNLKQLYKEHIPSFEQAVPLLESLSTNISIDKFIIAAFWMDSPMMELYKIPKQDHNVELNTNNMMSLTFIMFLELGNILAIEDSYMLGLYRLSYLLISVKWIDIFSDENNKLVVSSLMSHYLAQPRLIDIDARINKNLSFYDLYQDLLMKYFFESLSDTTMANIVIFPCAMRFPAKYRRHLWGDCDEYLRLLTIDISQSILPIDEYLSPGESNNDMIRYYWRAIRDKIVTEDRNPLLYWVCVHHLNRFVYNETIESDEELRGTQRRLAKDINLKWEHHKWMDHIRLYNDVLDNMPRFYDDMPDAGIAYWVLLQS